MIILVACPPIMARDEAELIADRKADSGAVLPFWHQFIKDNGDLTIPLFTEVLNILFQLGEKLIFHLLLLKKRLSLAQATPITLAYQQTFVKQEEELKNCSIAES